MTHELGPHAMAALGIGEALRQSEARFRLMADCDVRPPDRVVAAAGTEDVLDLSDVRVLVIDDEPDSRNLLKRMLEQRHAAVQTGESVVDALAALARSPFHVVVSDIGMPDQDGYDLVRQLRSLPGKAASTPAIAVTAFARAEDRRRALGAGFQRHIAKPVDPAELLAAVATMSGRARRP